MIQVAQEDLTDLMTFALKWRWTTESHALFSAAELARIRPLRREKAIGFLARSLELFPVVHGGDFDEHACGASDRTPADAGDVRGWLAERLPSARTPILVCWKSNHGVLTDTELFVPRWDDFCYPSSDDIMVLPLTAAWALRYDHEEEFVFAKRSSTG